MEGGWFFPHQKWSMRILLFFVVVPVLEYDKTTINIQAIPKWFFQKLQSLFLKVANVHGHS